MELAVRAEEYISASQVLEIANAVSLGIVCFRVNTGDAGMDEKDLEEINRNVLARIFWDDLAFISSTSLGGQFFLRLCILNHTTTWDDVHQTLEAIERFGREAFSKQVGHL